MTQEGFKGNLGSLDLGSLDLAPIAQLVRASVL